MSTLIVTGLRSLLLDSVDILAQRSVDMWAPSFGPCKARKESSETVVYARADNELWGDWPLQVVWKGANLLYVAVLEHVRSVATLRQAPHRFWSPAALARVAVEAAAQARWLLDSNLPNGRTRVGRYYTMYLHSSGQLEYTHLRTQSPSPVADYGGTKGRMKVEAAQLGLAPVLNKRNEIIGFENQQWPKVDDLVAKVIGSTGGYSVLSGASHAEFWSLLGAYREGEPSPLGVRQDMNDASFESFKLVAHACINALAIPVVEVMKLFDRKTLANDLAGVARMAKPLLGEL